MKKLYSPDVPVPEPAILAERFMHWMQMRNCTESTIRLWSGVLRRFWQWSDQRGLGCVSEVTTEILNSYRRHLFHYRQPRTGEPIKFCTQIGYLTPVRRWFEWLHTEGWIEQDVTDGFELPKEERRLPINTLTAEQVEQVLNATDTSKPIGIRDRAMMETFYSTGIRCSELGSLDVYDVEAARNVVKVRLGKGRKDRVAPIGQRALSWISKYTHDVRPELVAPTNETRLFVSMRGRALGQNHISYIVKSYLNKVGIEYRGSCHLLRHSAATLMMEHGADLRSLQMFLGHERLNTTQIYTHVTIDRLKQVHARTHPADLPPKDKETDADED